MPVKLNVKSCFLYILFAAACVFLNGAVSGVPLSLCLYFPLLICGGNAVASPLIYIACSAVHWNLYSIACSLFEAGFTLAVTLIYRRTGRKIKYEAAAYMCVALAPYVIFCEWTGMQADILGDDPYIYKGIAAGVVLLFFLFGYKAVYACIFRLGRCRLKEDELICLAAIYSAAGAGAVNLAGGFAYIAFTIFALSAVIRFFKSPSAIICSVVFSCPLIITGLEIAPLTAYISICLFSLIFCRAGKIASCLAVYAGTAAYCYLYGYFDGEIAVIVIRATVPALCGMLAALPSEKTVKKFRDKLTLKKELSDTAVNRERERT
ncbi:MAG: hypothetical protein LUD27_07520, partial [Clostridia bacterium]|nr:hypothetical protein [Clostridia bacterium]